MSIGWSALKHWRVISGNITCSIPPVCLCRNCPTSSWGLIYVNKIHTQRVEKLCMPLPVQLFWKSLRKTNACSSTITMLWESCGQINLLRWPRATIRHHTPVSPPSSTLPFFAKDTPCTETLWPNIECAYSITTISNIKDKPDFKVSLDSAFTA